MAVEELDALVASGLPVTPWFATGLSVVRPALKELAAAQRTALR